jgi:hypothetical protein
VALTSLTSGGRSVGKILFWVQMNDILVSSTARESQVVISLLWSI